MEWDGVRWQPVENEALGLLNAINAAEDSLPFPYSMIDESLRGIVKNAIDIALENEQPGSKAERVVKLEEHKGLLGYKRTEDPVGTITCFAQPDGEMIFMGNSSGEVHMLQCFNNPHNPDVKFIGHFQQATDAIVSMSACNADTSEDEHSHRLAYATKNEVHLVDCLAGNNPVFSQLCVLKVTSEDHDVDTTITQIQLSNDLKYLAVSLTSGVVNVYVLSALKANEAQQEPSASTKVKFKLFQHGEDDNTASQGQQHDASSSSGKLNANGSFEVKTAFAGVECQLHFQLPPPAVCTWGEYVATIGGKQTSGVASEGVSTTESSSTKPIKAAAKFHFIETMQERKIAMAPSFQTTSIVLWWPNTNRVYWYQLGAETATPFTTTETTSAQETKSGKHTSAEEKNHTDNSAKSSNVSVGQGHSKTRFTLSSAVRVSCVDENIHLLAFGLADGSVVLFDARIGVIKHLLAPHTRSVCQLAFYKQDYLTTVDLGGNVHILDLSLELTDEHAVSEHETSIYSSGTAFRKITGPHLPGPVQSLQVFPELPVAMLAMAHPHGEKLAPEVMLVDLASGSILGKLTVLRETDKSFGKYFFDFGQLSASALSTATQPLFIVLNKTTNTHSVYAYNVSDIILTLFPAIDKYCDENAPIHARREMGIDVFLGTPHADRHNFDALRGQKPQTMMNNFSLRPGANASMYNGSTGQGSIDRFSQAQTVNTMTSAALNPMSQNLAEQGHVGLIYSQLKYLEKTRAKRFNRIVRRTEDLRQHFLALEGHKG